jgi:hypothetical protein
MLGLTVSAMLVYGMGDVVLWEGLHSLEQQRDLIVGKDKSQVAENLFIGTFKFYQSFLRIRQV